MKNFEQWMQAYARDHQNSTNKMIHRFCVPLIMFSVLALLWAVPFPALIQNQPVWLNFSSIVVVLASVFYFRLNAKYASIMLMISVVMLSIIYFLATTPYLLAASLIIFVLSWIGQFVGHKIEGQKPSFFEDLQFLLIGPLWVVREILKES